MKEANDNSRNKVNFHVISKFSQKLSSTSEDVTKDIEEIFRDTSNYFANPKNIIVGRITYINCSTTYLTLLL